jgi:hypothetical protein
MKPLETPDDIRAYIRELILKEVSNFHFDSIQASRDIADKLIFAVDHYIDLKIDLAIKQCLEASSSIKEVEYIPDKLGPRDISKGSKWKDKKK